MEYKERKLCKYGLSCRFLREGNRCWNDHPDWHRQQIQRERNSQHRFITQPISSPFGQITRPTTLQQYPNDPTTYETGGFNRNPNSNPSRRYPRTQNTQRPNNNQFNYHRNHNQRYQRPQQFDQSQCYQRPNQNSDRDRSRDLMYSNTFNRNYEENRSPQYQSQHQSRRNFHKNSRRSPEYNVRSYNNQNNRQNHSQYPEVKPEKNQREIKMNFSQKVQKIQQEVQSDQPRYQPNQSFKDCLPGLFPSNTQELNLSGFLSAVQQANRIALIRRREQRRARELRQLRLRPGQNRYFYGNQRLAEENANMIEQNRIEEEERQRWQREFPTMQELTGLVENTENRRQLEIDDEYGFDDGYLSQEGFESEVILDLNQEENFNWFVERNKFTDGSKLTYEKLKQLDKCTICQIQYTELHKPQETQKKEKQQSKSEIMAEEKKEVNQQQEVDDQNLIMQLYCSQKHYFHKGCAVMWLKKQLSDVSKASCPICRKDFRDHDVYAQEDPDFRSRFLFARHELDQESDFYEDDSAFSQEQGWQQQLQRYMQQRRVDPIIADIRMQNVIERNERRAAEIQEWRRRRNRERDQRRAQARIDVSQSEESSLYPRGHIDISQSQESRLYPREEESVSHVTENVQNQWAREQNPVNPEKDKQYWEQYFKKQPEKNPFTQTENDQSNSQPESNHQNEQQ